VYQKKHRGVSKKTPIFFAAFARPSNRTLPPAAFAFYPGIGSAPPGHSNPALSPVKVPRTRLNCTYFKQQSARNKFSSLRFAFIEGKKLFIE